MSGEEPIEWCQAYRAWTSMLTGYPTLLDCKPSPRAEPSAALGELETLATLLSQQAGIQEGLQARDKPPERIGGVYTVYKRILSTRGGRGRSPLGELRIVSRHASSGGGALVWAGAVLAYEVPGLPSKPLIQPSPPPIPEGVGLDPPQAPEGQKTIRKPIVYSAEGPIPVPSPGEPGSGSLLSIRYGSYNEIMPLPHGRVSIRDYRFETMRVGFHCVTGWSVGSIEWRGVPLLELLDSLGLKGSWIIGVSRGGYTSIIPYDEEILENALVAVELNGEPLPPEHGGPTRLIIPRLYAWKSVKWLEHILVGDTYLDGYWEARGYHWRALIVLGERFKDYTPPQAEPTSLLQ